MNKDTEKVKYAITELNQHIITILLSRVATIVGIPSAGFIMWSMVTDIKEIEDLINQIDRRLFIVEYKLNNQTNKSELNGILEEYIPSHGG